MDAFYLREPRYFEYVKKLCSIKGKYPFVKISSLGHSVQGRKIYALSLGNENVKIMYAAAFHAQEWLTESLCLLAFEEICNRYMSSEKIRSALLKRGLVCVPCTNPDGVELVLSNGESAGSYCRFVKHISGGDLSNWQANIRGVDLNHNFDAGFEILKAAEQKSGIISPSARQYGGVRPHSENETRSLVTFLQRNCVLRLYAFHSQGEEIFYSYDNIKPRSSEKIASVLSRLSGYSLSEQSGLASHGGFKDYFIKKYMRPGFTIEIGRGKNPLPIGELSSIFACLYEMFEITLVI